MVMLRTVRPGESPRPSMTISQAAKDGSRRDLLVALRARIATCVESPTTLPRDLASLSLRLLEIAKEIEAIDAKAGGDAVSRAAATPDKQWAEDPHVPDH